MDQEQLDGHINHLRGVIRLAKGKSAYTELVQGIAVAFQGVAPGDKNVAQLARTLNKINFDPENENGQQAVNRNQADAQGRNTASTDKAGVPQK